MLFVTRLFVPTCVLNAAQHHDSDGHKNGMRGFHMKMYAENGVPELEVVNAEVCSTLD